MNGFAFKKTILALASQDLTINQIVVLLMSDIASVSMSELAEATQTSASNVTGTVARMIALGYVRRSHDENDRRKVLVSITAKGKEALTSLREKL